MSKQKNRKWLSQIYHLKILFLLNQNIQNIATSPTIISKLFIDEDISDIIWKEIKVYADFKSCPDHNFTEERIKMLHWNFDCIRL